MLLNKYCILLITRDHRLFFLILLSVKKTMYIYKQVHQHTTYICFPACVWMQRLRKCIHQQFQDCAENKIVSSFLQFWPQCNQWHLESQDVPVNADGWVSFMSTVYYETAYDVYYHSVLRHRVPSVRDDVKLTITFSLFSIKIKLKPIDCVSLQEGLIHSFSHYW